MAQWTAEDSAWMARVLALAAEAHGTTSPNPLVGAVVVGPQGLVGTGVHRRAGSPHAEPQALDAALAAIGDAGASLTLYVNLEPCSHHGQTPPCVDAILRARVGRVVTAMVDPNPLVAGRGIERLRATGVRVDVGCLGPEAAELNHVFVARQLRRRPFVALKVALAADASIAGAGGEPARITGEAARLHTHRLRAGLDSILVGVRTLARDRPRLDRRLYHGPGRNPRRLVFDPNLRCRPEWLWAPFPDAGSGWDGRALVFCAEDSLARHPDPQHEFAARAEIVPLPRTPTGLDLGAFAAALESRGLWSVLVEGGGHTHLTFLEADMWDRLYVYRNPGLRLNGVGWEAAPAWEAARSAAVERRQETLGEDLLAVFDHRRSVIPNP